MNISKEKRELIVWIISNVVLVICFVMYGIRDYQHTLVDEYKRGLLNSIREIGYSCMMDFEREEQQYRFVIESEDLDDYDFQNAAITFFAIVKNPWNDASRVVYEVKTPTSTKEYSYVNEGGKVYAK